MASRFHQMKQRRAERAPLTSSGHINLVPLVDILTSIVFFSLLTYTGALMTNLTAFDLSLPPVVVTAEQARNNAAQRDTLTLLLAVKVSAGRLEVQHSGGPGGPPFDQTINGMGDASLDSLQTVLTQIKQEFPDNNDIFVVPDDDVSYDDIVHVLERARMANFRNISLGSKLRGQQVAVGAPAAGGRP